MELFEIITYLYIFINVLAFIAFGIDKLKAIRHQWRIPEKTLLLLSLVGPTGSLLSMLLFRHKIKKLKFILLVPIFLLIHITIWFLGIRLYI
ncbi:MAG: DUF1294 domain-containing protein [Firmicutes bacterium HGW-Firmicutes-1]|jgi:uncharacterized membrane protein YsdA (DUF1294 family)|nr:MAG: DUF1294 domain-containing protein [Firmicutes bacterium HGW-Firmicutes-1]